MRRSQGEEDARTAGRKALLALALAAAAALAPAPALAQAVLARVTEAGTPEPLQGVLLTLRDASGALAGSALTDARGRFLFTGLTPGRHALRAELIGHASEVREGIEVRPGGTELVELALGPRAIELEGIRVEGEERCRVRPEEGLRVAAVWDEARKALEAARWTEERGVYQYRMRRWVRDVDGESGRVVRQESERTTLYGRAPYESRPAEDLLENGFVQPAEDEAGGDLYFGPDASVLLSDPFLDTHCLRLREGRDEEAGLVGIGFEPVRGRRLPDIEGTLWLRPETGELSHLEYGYVNLRTEIGLRGVGGRIAFRRLPNGTWIVPEWWIRMPWLAESRDLRGETRIFQAGTREEGGAVLRVREPGGDVVLSASAATLEGVVLEEISSEPVRGAVVTLAGTGERAVTDAEGRFRFPELVPGRYDVVFRHPAMDAYGHVPEPVRRDVEAGEVVAVRLRMPSAISLQALACPEALDTRPEGTAILVGRVTGRDSGRGLAGAEVTIEWDGFSVEGAGTEHVRVSRSGRGVVATADGEGRYRACVVPRDTGLRVRARWGGLESAEDTIRIPGDASVSGHDLAVPGPSSPR